MAVANPDIIIPAESCARVSAVELWMPGCDMPVLHGDTKCRISVLPWLGKCADAVKLYPDTDTTPTHIPSDISYDENAVIAKEQYLKNVKSVIAACASRGGKTVYSRIRAEVASANTFASFKNALFKAFPDTYRFAFSHPQLGYWVGASPELLFSYDKNTRKFRTMAIAGTRPRNTSGLWDEKNIVENDFVVRFIVSALESLGVSPVASEPHTVAYGKVEHLCVDITGVIPEEKVYDAIDLLNPTPALCGYPREAAIQDINAFEPHSRGCYGGVILYETDTEITAFVILRCCRYIDGKMLFYVGGGISALSDPEKEWMETEAKAESLIDYIPRIESR